MTSRSQAIKEIQNDFGEDLESLSLHLHLESQPWEERLGAGRASLDGHMGRNWGPVSPLPGQRETAKPPRSPLPSASGWGGRWGGGGSQTFLHVHMAVG